MTNEVTVNKTGTFSSFSASNVSLNCWMISAISSLLYRPVARSENPGGLVVLWWA